MSLYVALHEYTAQQEGDISFHRGDTILVNDPDEREHWWIGRVMDEDEDSDSDVEYQGNNPVGRGPTRERTKLIPTGGQIDQMNKQNITDGVTSTSTSIN